MVRRNRVRTTAAGVAAAVTLALMPGAAGAVVPEPRVLAKGVLAEEGLAEEGLAEEGLAERVLEPSPAGRGAVRKREIDGLLSLVNRARADVGVPPLVWDRSVAAHARHWAGRRVADCRLAHSNSRYGENLAKGSSPYFSLADAARLWIDEKDDYDRASNSCVNEKQCLHYTQVVWRASTRIGAAKVRCDNGWTYVVANFDPPGNWVGRRPY